MKATGCRLGHASRFSPDAHLREEKVNPWGMHQTRIWDCWLTDPTMLCEDAKLGGDICFNSLLVRTKQLVYGAIKDG